MTVPSRWKASPAKEQLSALFCLSNKMSEKAIHSKRAGKKSGSFADLTLFLSEFVFDVQQPGMILVIIAELPLIFE